MEFRVLGDIEVYDEGHELPMGGPKQRALLAILLLRVNETVSRERLIDELWGEHPPPSARHTLDSHVHRLRRALGGPGAELIRTRGAGYQLIARDDQVDFVGFQRLCANGVAALADGSNRLASDTLTAALELWHGPALANLRDEPFARVEADRLEELRLAALESRIEADLALGDHATLIGELQRLVTEHPLRERFRSQLMLSLYRSGRQAAALDAYQRAREHLVENLGLDPGRELQEMNTAILLQDSALDLQVDPNEASLALLTKPSDRAEGDGGVDRIANTADALAPRPRRIGPAPPGYPRQSRSMLGAGAILAGLAAALLLIAIFGGEDHTADAQVAADAAGFIPSGSTTPSSVALPGSRPTAIALGSDAAWITDEAGSQVLKLDRATHAVIDRIPLNDAPSAIAVGHGSIWVASAGAGVVYEIDPGADRVVASVPVGNGPVAIAAGAHGIWVADATDGAVRRIDPKDDRVTATTQLGEPLDAIGVGLGSVWTSSGLSGELIRIDPNTGHVIDSTAVGNDPQSIAIGGGAVYVSNSTDETVSRFDPRTGSQRKFEISDPGALAWAGGNSLWVSQPLHSALELIDPDDGSVRRHIAIGSPAVALAADDQGLALTTGAGPSSHRGGTLNIVGGDYPDAIDPGSSYSNPGFGLLSITNPGLIGYAREPGPAGAGVEAELATTVPAPSNGGRSYTFQLRPGLTYSDGSPVRASDFLRAARREYASSKGLAALGVPLVGAAACARSKDTCRLTRGVLANDAERRVTYRLTRPDATFLQRLALPFGAPVPAGSPPIGSGQTSIPGAGAYEISEFSAGKLITLERNPHFGDTEGPSDGFANRMRVRLGLSATAQIAAVRSGRADVMLDPPPQSLLPALLRRSSEQAHGYVQPYDLGMFLNSSAPPFDDVDARKAVNFAVDRAAVARLLGGRSLARPSCQVIPPGIPGYSPYCPYTRSPSASGNWRGPDLARARALLERSGTSGSDVVVGAYAGDPQRLAVARYFVRLLDRLGYRVRLETSKDENAYYSRISNQGSGIDVGIDGWVSDFPSASDFFEPLFGCRSSATFPSNNPSGFCEPALDARIRRTASRGSNNPALNARSWRRIDRAVTDQAPWAMLANIGNADYVGKRVANYQRSPELGILLDRIWVR